jgi:SAM-dependent methyltransferase
MSEALAKSLYTVYTEDRTPIHDEITDNQFKAFANHGYGFSLDPESPTILDVGCGMGVAWPVMREVYGYADIRAITPNPVEIAHCQKSGVKWVGSVAGEADIWDRTIDMIWCRHALEHSINPFADCLNFRRFLKDQGGLYVEVPAPDTVCNHEINPNHYSVMGDRMWKSLFDKAGFSLRQSGVINIELEIGPDQYFWYITEKKKED